MQVFVARQPIFDRRLRVIAYELLFRSGLDNFFKGGDVDHASSRVIADSFLLFGMEALTGGKRAFINFSRDILVKEYALLLPKESIVVELLETIEPDSAVIASAQQLKRAGYLIALDDFVFQERMIPLLDLADYVKVDFLVSPREECESIARRVSTLRAQLLAEKVETKEDFDAAVRMGYTYFQGYFFSKPVIVSGKDIPGFKLNYLRLLREINTKEFDFGRLESIMKQDVSISYKLLRYINSAAFGFRDEIRSIKDALVLLGERNIRKLTSLWMLAGLGQDKPEELVVSSIVRAQLCESLAAPAGLSSRQSELFLLGLFSLIDAIVDRPMPDLLAQLAVSEDVHNALLGRVNPLRGIFDAVVAYEQGEWSRCSERAAVLGVSEDEIPRRYIESVEWAGQIFQDRSGTV